MPPVERLQAARLLRLSVDQNEGFPLWRCLLLDLCRILPDVLVKADEGSYSRPHVVGLGESQRFIECALAVLGIGEENLLAN